MNQLIAVLALVLSAPFAQAASAPVAQFSANEVEVLGFRYGLNLAKGRAWAVVKLHEIGHSFSDFPNATWWENVQVPALRFDARASEITLTTERGDVACAKVVVSRSKVRIQPTGACVFSTTSGSREIDNGFTSRREATIDVLLEAN
jgi:hypothetical protein